MRGRPVLAFAVLAFELASDAAGEARGMGGIGLGFVVRVAVLAASELGMHRWR